jgi:hypothetical protein
MGGHQVASGRRGDGAGTGTMGSGGHTVGRRCSNTVSSTSAAGPAAQCSSPRPAQQTQGRANAAYSSDWTSVARSGTGSRVRT